MPQIPELRYAQPVSNLFAGQQYRMQEQGTQLKQRGEIQRQQGESQRQDIVGAQEERKKQLDELDLTMKNDAFQRSKILNSAHDAADKLMSVLEADPANQEQLFSQIYSELGQGVQEKFPEGRFNPETATALVRSAISVLDRYKMLAAESVAKTKAQTDLEKERIKSGGKGGAKTADYNLIRKAIADGLNATFDEVTGSIRGLSSEDSTTAKRIAARAERIFKDGGGDVTPTEAATKALDEWGYKGRPPQTEADKMKLPENDPLGLR